MTRIDMIGLDGNDLAKVGTDLRTTDDTKALRVFEGGGDWS